MDEPIDAFQDAQTYSEFPHEPTHDQWLSELQLEDSRTLGRHIVNWLCEDAAVPVGQGGSTVPLAAWCRRVEHALTRGGESMMLIEDLAVA